MKFPEKHYVFFQTLHSQVFNRYLLRGMKDKANPWEYQICYSFQNFISKDIIK